MGFGTHGKTALIAGASDGLGSETARPLAEEGAALMLTDLDADALRPIAEAVDAASAPSDPTTPDGANAFQDSHRPFLNLKR